MGFGSSRSGSAGFYSVLRGSILTWPSRAAPALLIEQRSSVAVRSSTAGCVASSSSKRFSAAPSCARDMFAGVDRDPNATASELFLDVHTLSSCCNSNDANVCRTSWMRMRGCAAFASIRRTRGARRVPRAARPDAPGTPSPASPLLSSTLSIFMGPSTRRTSRPRATTHSSTATSSRWSLAST
jgi:hypothetical protein